MQNEKVIERLKKLFALGQSSNQHEAELAMAKANEIMTEYQISATDIDLEDDGEVVKEEMELEGGKHSTWLATLANSCARLYDARAYYAPRRYGSGLLLRFYGTPADIMAAKMTFNHLRASWESIVRMDMPRLVDKKAFKRAHGMGFTQAIGVRVAQLVEARKAKVVSVTGRDLVLVKGAALDDFMSGVKIGKRNTANPRDANGYHAGHAAGSSIALSGAIEEEKPLLLARV